MSPDSDCLIRYSFADVAARGAGVRLGETWRAVRLRNDFDHTVQQILGEALAASSLLLSGIKIQARLSLQLQSDGPLRLLLAQCSSDGAQRAIVRCDQPLPACWDFSKLDDEATLVLSIEGLNSDHRYQGIVPLGGATLAAALESYFRQSEQLDTHLWLVADHQRAAGLMLQRLPGSALDSEAWNRITTLANTLTLEELLALPTGALLGRLFHQENVLDGGSAELRFECQCTRERVVQVLLVLGKEELGTQLAEKSEVTVDCEFCNERYRFDPVDIDQLFAAHTAQPETQGPQ